MINTEEDLKTARDTDHVSTIWSTFRNQPTPLLALQYSKHLFVNPPHEYVCYRYRDELFVMYRFALWDFHRGAMENAVTVLPMTWTAEMKVNWTLTLGPLPNSCLIRIRDKGKIPMTCSQETRYGQQVAGWLKHTQNKRKMVRLASSNWMKIDPGRPCNCLYRLEIQQRYHDDHSRYDVVLPYLSPIIPRIRPRLTLPELHDHILHHIATYLPMYSYRALKFACRTFFFLLPLRTIPQSAKASNLSDLPPWQPRNHSATLTGSNAEISPEQVTHCLAFRHKLFPLRSKPQFLWTLQTHYQLEEWLTDKPHADPASNFICAGCGKVRALNHVRGRSWADVRLRLCLLCIEVVVRHKMREFTGVSPTAEKVWDMVLKLNGWKSEERQTKTDVRRMWRERERRASELWVGSCGAIISGTEMPGRVDETVSKH